MKTRIGGREMRTGGDDPAKKAKQEESGEKKESTPEYYKKPASTDEKALLDDSILNNAELRESGVIKPYKISRSDFDEFNDRFQEAVDRKNPLVEMDRAERQIAMAAFKNDPELFSTEIFGFDSDAVIKSKKGGFKQPIGYSRTIMGNSLWLKTPKPPDIDSKPEEPSPEIPDIGFGPSVSSENKKPRIIIKPSKTGYRYSKGLPAKGSITKRSK